MKQNKLNRMHDALLNLYKNKDIDGLINAAKNYPTYAQKAQCYVDRIKRKKNG